MTVARREIVSEAEERSYHCNVRCVRRAYLCGLDGYTGRNYDHRKEWIRKRLILLSRTFAADVLGYAVMDNHCHVVVRMSPERVLGWSAEEVARRWLAVYCPRRLRSDEGLRAAAEAAIARDGERVLELRRRLGSLSWFMGSLDEYIARKANAEDGVTGRFWEGRFKCRALLDEGALLACLAYVDLNPIRAGKAQTPEESEYTSVYERIHAEGDEEDPAREIWLSPIRDSAYRRGVFMRLSWKEYLRVLDTTGRVLRRDKRGFIPGDLAPILDRLGIAEEEWPGMVRGYDGRFRRVIGRVEDMLSLAEAAGRQWFQGVSACRRLYMPGHG